MTIFYRAGSWQEACFNSVFDLKMPVNRLLILSADAEHYAAMIHAADLQQLDIVTADNVASAEATVAGCNIILGNPPWVSEVITSAQRLEWVQSSWAGVDRLCLPGSRTDYVLTGVKGVFGALMSEYVFAYLYALERRLFTMHENQLRKHWQPLPYRHARDITLGIIGLGSIGQHIARTARYFGMRAIGLNRSGRPCEAVETVYTVQQLANFLEQPDYLVLTLPETPRTRHFISRGELEMMKPSAVLINVGRGSIINETDLVIALQNGMIGGAVLDVFSTEPLPPDSPLWHLPNVYLSPHQAAVSFPEDVVAIFADNYRRFTNGQRLRHVVDFELGY